MSAKPLISVIVPVFNGMPYLEECLVSIVSQSRDGDVELIVVDGMSTDGTDELVKRFESAITHYIREADNGQLDAIRKGLAMASGQFVCYQCADDYYLPGGFDEIRKAVGGNSGADLIYGDLLLIDTHGSHLRTVRHVDASLEALRYSAFHTTSQVTFWSRKVNARLIEVLPMIDLTLGMERFIFSVVLYHATSFVRIRAVLGAFRVHAGSKTLISRHDAALREAEHHLMNRTLSDLGIIPKLSAVRFCTLHFKKLWQLASEGHWSELWYLMRNIVKVPKFFGYEFRGWGREPESKQP
ncbi:MAG: glycosyltransferase [Acidobacteria bacterium]|nr:glycosyltransferase [Acidobacteriota bacterium]